MDHDARPLEWPEPVSKRAVHVHEAYLQFSLRGLDSMTHQVAQDPTYDSNEQGHFAWDISLAVRAACLAWSITSDPSHLRQAIDLAQHMIERTDAATGRKNWRGESDPVWSAGSRYTAGTTDIQLLDGSSVVFQAAAEKLQVERPSEHTALVHVLNKDSRVWSSPESSVHPTDANYLPDVLSQKSTIYAVLLRGLKEPAPLPLVAGTYTLRPQTAAHLIHTGLISRALAGLATALEHASPRAVATSLTPSDLYAHAGAALRAHASELSSQASRTWYITPKDFPGRRLGTELPHNHIADAATAFMMLGTYTPDKDLHELGFSLAGRFLQEIRAYQTGLVPHPWYYYPVDSDTFQGVRRSEPLDERIVPPVRRAEDSSHATIRVRALADWKQLAGESLGDSTMQAVAASFSKHYWLPPHQGGRLSWLPGDGPSSPRTGDADTLVGAWAQLHPWADNLKRRINSLAFNAPPKTLFGGALLSATEIAALNKRGKRQPII